MAILPTGGGKTLLYQMYGAITHQRVMIVSPLISLMQDQVSRLQFLGSKRVVALTSALDFQEKMAILNHLNRYQFIYVSPEMLANDQVQQRLRRLSIGLFVVDEAHCISEWGPDFRPDYLKLGTVREMLGRPLTLMMTATATQPVRRDIIRHMNFRFEDVHQIVLPVNRANIFLSAKIFANQHDKDAALIELVKQLNGPGIIYFSSKSKAEQEHRSRDKAEVFTAAWICNKQNNLVDNAWFGREGVFNTEFFAEGGNIKITFDRIV